MGSCTGSPKLKEVTNEERWTNIPLEREKETLEYRENSSIKARKKRSQRRLKERCIY